MRRVTESRFIMSTGYTNTSRSATLQQELVMCNIDKLSITHRVTRYIAVFRDDIWSK